MAALGTFMGDDL